MELALLSLGRSAAEVEAEPASIKKFRTTLQGAVGHELS
jgi:hypothetical protein